VVGLAAYVAVLVVAAALEDVIAKTADA